MPGKKWELAWAAGLFEGEGCITVWRRVREGRRRTTGSLILASNDADVVERFVAAVGLGKARPWVTPSKPRPMTQWRLTGFENVQAVIAMLWPGLGTRRRARAVEVLRILKDETVPYRGIRGPRKVVQLAGT